MKPRTKKILIYIPAGLVAVLICCALFFTLTTAGLRSALFLADKFSGGQVHVDSASGRLISSLHLTGIHYVSNQLKVSVQSFNLHWHPLRLLPRALDVQSVALEGVQIHSLGKSTASEQKSTGTFAGFTLPLTIRLIDFSLQDLRIFSNGKESFDLTEARVIGLKAKEQEVSFQMLIAKNSWMDVQTNGKLETKGNLPLDVELDYAFDFAGYGPICGQGKVNGDLEKLALQTELSSPAALNLQGEILQVLRDLHWQARVTSPYLQLSAINAKWSDNAFDQIQIDGKGTIRDYDLQVAGRIVSKELQRPVGLQSNLKVGWEGLVAQDLTLKEGETQLHLTGKFDWSPALTWDVTLQSKDFDPNLVTKEWPGKLSGTLTTQGSYHQEQLNTLVKINELKGELRDFPCLVDGEIKLVNKDIDIPSLQLVSGDSKLVLKGNASEAITFAATLDSPDLAQLYPQLKGSAHVEAHLSGTRVSPHYTVKGQAENLGFSQYRLKQLFFDGQGILDKKRQIEALVHAEHLNLGSQDIDEAELHLAGDLDHHQVSLSAANKKDAASLELEIAGTVAGEKWSGKLVNMRVDSEATGIWLLGKETELVATEEQAKVNPLCLQQLESQICLQGNWARDSQIWQGNLQGKALPFKLLQTWLPPEISLQGMGDLLIDFTGKAGSIQSANLKEKATELKMNFAYAESASENLVWQKQELEATYSDRQLKLLLANELMNGNQLAVQLSVNKLSLSQAALENALLQGKLSLNFPKLGFLNALTKQRTIWDGALMGDLIFSGTLKDPRLQGKVQLEHGGLLVPRLGLHLSPLLVDVASRDGLLQVSVQAHGEKGQLAVDGGVDLRTQPPTLQPITFRGDAFRVANQPGFQLDVSPNLVVNVQEEGIDVQGKVGIPYAMIQAITFDKAITPSKDVEIVDDPRAKKEKEEHALSLDILLSLGDEVLVDAYGLRGRLAGQLQLHAGSGRPIAGNGSVSVQEGSFSVYGKRVKIDTGRILFTGGSLSNPGIDIRSQQAKDDTTVGVRVEGFLQTPRITLYSNPVMDQAAIIMNLVEDNQSFGGSSRDDTGTVGETAEKIGMGGLVPYLAGIKKLTMIDEVRLDTSDGIGSASMVFGSWLTPNFYISYGKKLLENGGTFNSHYKLGKGFFVKTESGEDANSGDITYEYEY